MGTKRETGEERRRRETAGFQAPRYYYTCGLTDSRNRIASSLPLFPWSNIEKSDTMSPQQLHRDVVAAAAVASSDDEQRSGSESGSRGGHSGSALGQLQLQLQHQPHCDGDTTAAASASALAVASSSPSESESGSAPRPPPSSQPQRLKRSPYLSMMADRSNRKSDDLVLQLSRPRGRSRQSLSASSSTGQLSTKTLAGGGATTSSNFFDLKRSSSCSPGTTAVQGEEKLLQLLGSTGIPRHHTSSLRSALRIGAPSVTAAAAAAASVGNVSIGGGGMTKNSTSVTFSHSTKIGNIAQLGGETLRRSKNETIPSSPPLLSCSVRKSQSIASPEFIMARAQMHQSQSHQTVSQQPLSRRMLSQQTLTQQSFFKQILSQQTPSQPQGEMGFGNASFPIHLSHLPATDHPKNGTLTPTMLPVSHQQARQQTPIVPTPHAIMQHHSKSVKTLQYYYQNCVMLNHHDQSQLTSTNNDNHVARDPARELLHAAGMTGIVTPVTARLSINGLNLTFKDLLDVGDGVEGDMNIRSRNQQWKEFCSFSDKFDNENPKLRSPAVTGEDGVGGGAGVGGSFDGHTSNSDLTSMTINPQLLSVTSADRNTKSHMPLSGVKRKHSSSSTTASYDPSLVGGWGGGGGHNDRISTGTGIVGPPPPSSQHHHTHNRTIAGGSHRDTVSVNDMAILRRAASRMKMSPLVTTPPGSGGRSSSNVGALAMQQMWLMQRCLGETLGGDMLSRISNSSSSNSAVGGGADPMMSPVVQPMMAKTNITTTSNNGGGGDDNIGRSSSIGGRGGDHQHMEIFLRELNLAMSTPAAALDENLVERRGSDGGGSSSLDKRSHRQIVSAGLAYGRGDMTKYVQSRNSSFDFGQLHSVSSLPGQQSSCVSLPGVEQNEDWD